MPWQVDRKNFEARICQSKRQHIHHAFAGIETVNDEDTAARITVGIAEIRCTRFKGEGPGLPGSRQAGICHGGHGEDQ